MSTKPTKATNRVRASTSGRTAAKLSNGPALIGYARVSTSDPDTSIQQVKLRDAGCTVIRAEKASGKARDGRNELEAVTTFIRPGGTLVVVKLDRLGRSTRDVLNLVHELEQRGAALRVLEPAIDTGGPMGRMVLTVLSMVAEMELGFIRDRQHAGIEAAKAKGVLQGEACHVRPREDRRVAKGGTGSHGDCAGRGVQARERVQGPQGG